MEKLNADMSISGIHGTSRLLSGAEGGSIGESEETIINTDTPELVFDGGALIDDTIEPALLESSSSSLAPGLFAIAMVLF